jgi:hypothetical protein
MNSSMDEPWNLSTPQWPLILLNTTFYLGFFGFTNTTNCLILYIIHPIIQYINIGCDDCLATNITWIANQHK